MPVEGRFNVYCNTDECSAEHHDLPMQLQQTNEDAYSHWEMHKCPHCLSHVTVIYKKKPGDAK